MDSDAHGQESDVHGQLELGRKRLELACTGFQAMVVTSQQLIEKVSGSFERFPLGFGQNFEWIIWVHVLGTGMAELW